ncbi:MAG: hypothetical protein HC866_11375 [Leptolyngbyaceae cyanobacterium RU_5_1]|nr:hypothetical protein [Leptolyngbyaceae cyanobacterium RU_5_1]
MTLKSTLLLSGAIALGIASLPTTPVAAQTIAGESSKLGSDLKLNSQQQKAVEAIAGFAFDQFETMIDSGFDPKKLDRAQTNQRADTLRQLFTSFRLDNQQKGALRTILQTAREQMKRQLEIKK